MAIALLGKPNTEYNNKYSLIRISGPNTIYSRV